MRNVYKDAGFTFEAITTTFVFQVILCLDELVCCTVYCWCFAPLLLTQGTVIETLMMKRS